MLLVDPLLNSRRDSLWKGLRLIGIPTAAIEIVICYRRYRLCEIPRAVAQLTAGLLDVDGDSAAYAYPTPSFGQCLVFTLAVLLVRLAH